ncbi:MAG: CpaF family protein [Acidiferrobacter sp.]
MILFGIAKNANADRSYGFTRDRGELSKRSRFRALFATTARKMRSTMAFMDAHQAKHIRDTVLPQLLGPVAPLLDDESLQEIMINRPDDIWVERAGRMERTELTLDPIAVRSTIVALGRLDNKDVRENTADAIVDTRLDGLRVAAALAPTAVHGSSLCLRKHSRLEIPLERYAEGESTHVIAASQEIPVAWPQSDLVENLREIVRQRKNLLISGGTSTGKSTFMNALLAAVPSDERVLVLEDVPELRLPAVNQVGFQSNAQAGITMRDLVRLALRYRPDRIVVGEVRGAESFDLLQAMNTGHDGGAASIHANSAFQALARLETLVLTANTGWPLEAVRHAIGSTIDWVIHMARHRGRRVVAEVLAVRGYGTSGYVTTRVY